MGIVDRLIQRLQELSVDFYQNKINGTDSCPLDFNVKDDGVIDYDFSCGCWMALNNYNYFVGPYQDLNAEQMNFANHLEIKQTHYKQWRLPMLDGNQIAIFFGVLSVFIFVMLVIKCVK